MIFIRNVKTGVSRSQNDNVVTSGTDSWINQYPINPLLCYTHGNTWHSQEHIGKGYLWYFKVPRWLSIGLPEIPRVTLRGTVYPKKYAHGFCFAVLCCGYILTDFPMSIRLTSLALWQSIDCPSASKATLMNMDKYFTWIHYERLHNHNKAKHNKTVCIFLGIYCMIIWYLPSSVGVMYGIHSQEHVPNIDVIYRVKHFLQVLRLTW